MLHKHLEQQQEHQKQMMVMMEGLQAELEWNVATPLGILYGHGPELVYEGDSVLG